MSTSSLGTGPPDPIAMLCTIEISEHGSEISRQQLERPIPAPGGRLTYP